MNKEGAISGMVLGLFFTAGYIIYFKFVDPTANVPANWFLGISPEGIGNFVVAAIVCKLTAAAPAHVQEMVESIRFPKGAGEASGH